LKDARYEKPEVPNSSVVIPSVHIHQHISLWTDYSACYVGNIEKYFERSKLV